MKINITKEKNDYSLSIQSGHFTGNLSNISKESLEDLYLGLKNLLDNKEEDNSEIVWNPRSQRHEYNR